MKFNIHIKKKKMESNEFGKKLCPLSTTYYKVPYEVKIQRVRSEYFAKTPSV